MGISHIVDAHRLRPLQILLILLVLLALVIDGVDIQLLSLVAPVILKEWAVTKASFGPAMGAALIGMSIGAGLGGWTGDRYGRKSTLTAAIFLFGVATVGASFTHSTTLLALLRLVTGLGFGAAAPNGIALLSEWLPQRVQSRAISLMSAAVPVGGLVGAAGVYWLLPSYGWRGCFVICGVATLIVGVAIAIFLPESADFALAKGKRDRAEALLQRVLGRGTKLTDADVAPTATHERRAAAGESMFGAPYRRLNAGIWLLFVGINFVAYGIAAWTPVYLTAAGFALSEAIGVIFIHSLTAVSFAALTSLVIRRLGSRMPLTVCCAASFLCICLLALTLADAHGAPSVAARLMVTITCAGIGGFNGAAIALTYALLAFAYPTSCRARGIGVGIMIGRIGGAGATLFGGALLSLDGDSTVPFFIVCGGLTLSSLVGVKIINRHIPMTRGVTPPGLSEARAAALL